MAGQDDDLANVLGGAPPDGVAALGETDRARLARLIADQRARQRRELAEAQEAALDHVPRLVRGIVKRIVGG